MVAHKPLPHSLRHKLASIKKIVENSDEFEVFYKQNK
jgi:hypothetical protein